MILNTDKEIIQQADVRVKRLSDIEKSVRRYLSSIKAEYRWGVCSVWLKYRIIKRLGYYVTPLVIISTPVGEIFDPETVELDLNNIYQQIEDRLIREKLNWKDVKLV